MQNNYNIPQDDFDFIISGEGGILPSEQRLAEYGQELAKKCALRRAYSAFQLDDFDGELRLFIDALEGTNHEENRQVMRQQRAHEIATVSAILREMRAEEGAQQRLELAPGIGDCGRESAESARERALQIAEIQDELGEIILDMRDISHRLKDVFKDMNER